MEPVSAQESGSTSGGGPPDEGISPVVPPIVSSRKRKRQRRHRSQKKIKERKAKQTKEEAESSDTATEAGEMDDTPSRSISPRTVPFAPIDEPESPSPRDITAELEAGLMLTAHDLNERHGTLTRENPPPVPSSIPKASETLDEQRGSFMFMSTDNVPKAGTSDLGETKESEWMKESAVYGRGMAATDNENKEERTQNVTLTSAATPNKEVRGTSPDKNTDTPGGRVPGQSDSYGNITFVESESRNQMADTKAGLQSVREENKELRKENESLREDFSELRKENNRLKALSKGLEQDVSRFSDDAVRHSNEAATLKAKLRDTEQKLSTATYERKDAEKKMVEIEMQVIDLEEKNTECEESLKKARETRNDIEREVIQLRQENAKALEGQEEGDLQAIIRERNYLKAIVKQDKEAEEVIMGVLREINADNTSLRKELEAIKIHLDDQRRDMEEDIGLSAEKDTVQQYQPGLEEPVLQDTHVSARPTALTLADELSAGNGLDDEDEYFNPEDNEGRRYVRPPSEPTDLFTIGDLTRNDDDLFREKWTSSEKPPGHPHYNRTFVRKLIYFFTKRRNVAFEAAIHWYAEGRVRGYAANGKELYWVDQDVISRIPQDLERRARIYNDDYPDNADTHDPNSGFAIEDPPAVDRRFLWDEGTDSTPVPSASVPPTEIWNIDSLAVAREAFPHLVLPKDQETYTRYVKGLRYLIVKDLVPARGMPSWPDWEAERGSGLIPDLSTPVPPLTEIWNIDSLAAAREAYPHQDLPEDQETYTRYVKGLRYLIMKDLVPARGIPSWPDWQAERGDIPTPDLNIPVTSTEISMPATGIWNIDSLAVARDSYPHLVLPGDQETYTRYVRGLRHLIANDIAPALGMPSWPEWEAERGGYLAQDVKAYLSSGDGYKPSGSGTHPGSGGKAEASGQPPAPSQSQAGVKPQTSNQKTADNQTKHVFIKKLTREDLKREEERILMKEVARTGSADIVQFVEESRTQDGSQNATNSHDITGNQSTQNSSASRNTANDRWTVTIHTPHFSTMSSADRHACERQFTIIQSLLGNNALMMSAPVPSASNQNGGITYRIVHHGPINKMQRADMEAIRELIRRDFGNRLTLEEEGLEPVALAQSQAENQNITGNKSAASNQEKRREVNGPVVKYPNLKSLQKSDRLKLQHALAGLWLNLQGNITLSEDLPSEGKLQKRPPIDIDILHRDSMSIPDRGYVERFRHALKASFGNKLRINEKPHDPAAPAQTKARNHDTVSPPDPIAMPVRRSPPETISQRLANINTAFGDGLHDMAQDHAKDHSQDPNWIPVWEDKISNVRSRYKSWWSWPSDQQDFTRWQDRLRALAEAGTLGLEWPSWRAVREEKKQEVYNESLDSTLQRLASHVGTNNWVHNEMQSEDRFFKAFEEEDKSEKMEGAVVPLTIQVFRHRMRELGLYPPNPSDEDFDSDGSWQWDSQQLPQQQTTRGQPTPELPTESQTFQQPPAFGGLVGAFWRWLGYAEQQPARERHTSQESVFFPPPMKPYTLEELRQSEPPRRSESSKIPKARLGGSHLAFKKTGGLASPIPQQAQQPVQELGSYPGLEDQGLQVASPQSGQQSGGVGYPGVGSGRWKSSGGDPKPNACEKITAGFQPSRYPSSIRHNPFKYLWLIIWDFVRLLWYMLQFTFNLIFQGYIFSIRLRTPFYVSGGSEAVAPRPDIPSAFWVWFNLIGQIFIFLCVASCGYYGGKHFLEDSYLRDRWRFANGLSQNSVFDWRFDGIIVKLNEAVYGSGELSEYLLPVEIGILTSLVNKTNFYNYKPVHEPFINHTHVNPKYFSPNERYRGLPDYRLSDTGANTSTDGQKLWGYVDQNLMNSSLRTSRLAWYWAKQLKRLVPRGSFTNENITQRWEEEWEPFNG